MLSRVNVIVPYRFYTQEGLTSTTCKLDGRSLTTKCCGDVLRAGTGKAHAGLEAGAARYEGCVEYSPTAGTRLIGEVERLRHASGLSMEAAAQRLGWSTSKLYRLEQAGRGSPPTTWRTCSPVRRPFPAAGGADPARP